MRIMLLLSMLALSPMAWGVDWRPLPSPAEYSATVDLDSVSMQQGVGRFTLRRAYSSAQSHSSGMDYYSTRLQYFAYCSEGTAALVATQYYGEDRKLIQADIRPRLKKSEFATPEPGSDVAEAVQQACNRLAESGKSEPGGIKKADPGPAGTAKPPVRRSSSASGIVVTRDGLILTNQHVVKECDAYEVINDANRRLKATLQAEDAAKDLALLAVEERFPSAAPVRKDAAPKLGEAVTVVGYPLVNVLGARPSVGFGHVSATVGIRGNPTQMQISVPIQRGNSGGPLLDQAGNIIGIVVSKLDALKVAERVGDLPQNINFAIRGDVIRSFLDSQNISFTTSETSTKLENTEIASRGAAVTVLVRCIRGAVTATPATSVPAQP